MYTIVCIYNSMINSFKEHISHIGDIFAIPLFALLVIYFYKIKNKTIVEYILFLFSISGLILDSIFTYNYISNLE